MRGSYSVRAIGFILILFAATALRAQTGAGSASGSAGSSTNTAASNQPSSGVLSQSDLNGLANVDSQLNNLNAQFGGPGLSIWPFLFGGYGGYGYYGQGSYWPFASAAQYGFGPQALNDYLGGSYAPVAVPFRASCGPVSTSNPPLTEAARLQQNAEAAGVYGPPSIRLVRPAITTPPAVLNDTSGARVGAPIGTNVFEQPTSSAATESGS